MHVSLIAGDYWHAPGGWHRVMQQLVEEAGGTLTAHAGPNPLSEVLAAKPNTIILAREGNKPDGFNSPGFWLTAEDEAALAAYIHDGGHLLALHGGVCTYRHDGPVRAMMRGHFLRHPPQSDHIVRPTNHLAFDAFAVFDEFYEVDTDPTATNVFAELSSPEHGQQVAGWRHDYGAGHVAAFTPGHNRAILDNPSYRRVVSTLLAA